MAHLHGYHSQPTASHDSAGPCGSRRFGSTSTAIRIDNTEPAVAAFFSHRPGVVEEDWRADIVFEILDHVLKVIDVVTVHPVALTHPQAATRNGAAAAKSEAVKLKKYGDHFLSSFFASAVLLLSFVALLSAFVVVACALS